MTREELKRHCKATCKMFGNGRTTTRTFMEHRLVLNLLEQTTWIPVSERLPEGLMIKTLVSCENDEGLPVCTMIAVYDGFKQKWDCDYRVKAWMPLPKPYKAESEE